MTVIVPRTIFFEHSCGGSWTVSQMPSKVEAFRDRLQTNSIAPFRVISCGLAWGPFSQKGRFPRTWYFFKVTALWVPLKLSLLFNMLLSVLKLGRVDSGNPVEALLPFSHRSTEESHWKFERRVMGRNVTVKFFPSHSILVPVNLGRIFLEVLQLQALAMF